MKLYLKITYLLISVILISGCGTNKGTVIQSNINQKTLKIVTSFYPMYIFTQNIAKDVSGITVTNMTEIQTGCLHDYNLSPSDLKTLEKANIFIANGAGIESFMDKVIGQFPDLKIIEASKGIDFIMEDSGIANPHVWVSISGAISEVRNISEQLAKLDPKNAEKYYSNTTVYIKKLEAQKDKMTTALANCKNKNIVTFHEAFAYFAKEFNLNVVAAMENEHGSESTAKQREETIKIVKQLDIKALFAEPQYNSKTADLIARETGAKVFCLDPVVTGHKDSGPDAYTKIMDENLKTLLEALN